ncbi:flagellar basal-body MS-ring/collar protein FliF [Burkholderia contaminans]|uniref:flagellar basal-body MS-ring/collar protein FliF n=1 Tax=Burkholderia contaminans TaxID=488447 RepID=UPI00145354D7|nr:flagellar MS-ring protein [Burkholderia contaminans]
MLNQVKAALSRVMPSGVRLPSSASLMKLMPLVVLAICVTALAMMVMHHRDTRFKPLFGSQESISAADMMTVLETEGIPYRIHPESGQVLVPESQLGATRMLLAAKGVVAKLPAGLDQVDKSDPLGVSQFVQDVRFRRGLEGELVRSIVSIEPVESVRVHLSVAKSSSFILADGDKSSASVVLTLKQGRTLKTEQISAIVALVAGSVANLDPSRVAVVDQAGNHLSALIDPDSAAATDGELGVRIREETLRNIRELLQPTLGDGNFRASVTAEIDHDRVEETRERYGDTPKVMQEATRDERDGAQAALGVPGSLSNRPVAPPAAGQTADAQQSGRNAQSRQFAYDRNVVKIKRSPVRLKRLNVAVVVNNAAAPGGAKAWTPEQIERIDAVLRYGLGIDGARDDALVVSALDFRAPPAVETLPWWKQPDNIMSVATWCGYTVAALLIFLFVLRPLIKILREWVAGREPASPAATDEAQQPDDEPASGSGNGLRAAMLPEDAALPPVGSDVDVLAEHLKNLAHDAPERVAEVIKPWIRKHE